MSTSTAPRITIDDIEANIAAEHYVLPGNGTGVISKAGPASLPSGLPPEAADSLGMLTICVLVLCNGFRIVGVNEGPVSAATFDAEVGRRLAREKAIEQIWPLMGYELRSRLAATPVPKGYTWADVAELSVRSEDCGKQTCFWVRMLDGKDFTGSVPAQNTADEEHRAIVECCNNLASEAAPTIAP